MHDVTPSSPRIAALVLAAGPGTRFGGAKQLADVDGRPALARVLESFAAVDGLGPRVLALGADEERIRAALDLSGWEIVTVGDWAEGMSASLRAGIRALADRSDAVIVGLGDQPLVLPSTIERVIGAWDGQAPGVRPTHEGARGHPVLLAARLFGAIAELHGDVGARSLLREETIEVECGPEATLDLDTAEDLERLRRSASATDDRGA